MLRKYGNAPYNIAVIHGGPGASGEMAPVAKALSVERGVLEPLQAADSIAGQISELKADLEKEAAFPVALIGYSWGAWLSLIFAAENPSIVNKLILISCGPLEQAYVNGIQATRLKRLGEREREEIEFLMESMDSPIVRNKEKLFKRVGELFSKADMLDPVEGGTAEVKLRPDIYEKVWKEASRFRSSGRLLEYAEKVKCPVIAIHGDYDPHPAAGVEKPLSKAITKFKFILLKGCGHTPWLEKKAREGFYSVLKKELL